MGCCYKTTAGLALFLSLAGGAVVVYCYINFLGGMLTVGGSMGGFSVACLASLIALCGKSPKGVAFFAAVSCITLLAGSIAVAVINRHAIEKYASSQDWKDQVTRDAGNGTRVPCDLCFEKLLTFPANMIIGVSLGILDSLFLLVLAVLACKQGKQGNDAKYAKRPPPAEGASAA